MKKAKELNAMILQAYAGPESSRLDNRCFFLQ